MKFNGSTHSMGKCFRCLRELSPRSQHASWKNHSCLRLRLFILGAFLSGGWLAAAADPTAILPVPHLLSHPSKLLTVRDAVMLAIRNNPDLQSDYLDRIVQKYALEIAYNQFAPQYTLGLVTSYGTGTQPSYNSDPKVALTTPLGSTISVDDNNTWSGGTHSSTGTVSFTQPLLQGAGRAVAENSLYEALQTEKNNRLTLKSSVMETIGDVVQDYYALVSDYNALEITQLTIKSDQENLKQTQAKIKAGKAPRTDAVQYELNVAQDQLSITTQENQIQSDYQALLTILGLDPKSKLEIVKAIDIGSVQLPTLQQSIATALANNISYQQALIAYQSARQAVIVARNGREWTLNVGATLAKPLSGTGSSPVMTVDGDTSGITDRTAEVTLNIPINDVQSKADLEDAKIALQQAAISLSDAKRSTITLVINDYRNLQSQLSEINLNEQTVKLGEQNLKVEQLKAQYGQSTPLNVTTVQNTLTSDQQTLITAKITYINDLQTYYRDLGITLEKWGVALRY